MIVDLAIFAGLALAVILAGEVFKAFETMRVAREMAEREIRDGHLPVRRDRGSQYQQPEVNPTASGSGPRVPLQPSAASGAPRPPLPEALGAPQPLSDDDAYRLDPYGDLS